MLFITGAISPVIEYLQLTNGLADVGGGVYIDTAAVTLRYNRIYNNRAENWGGGIGVLNSSANILSNRIYANTTGENGFGGGMRLINSPARLQSNVIANNRAFQGGGVALGNAGHDVGAQLIDNDIEDNTAFDRYVNGLTYDGSGGGIHIGGWSADVLQDNRIRRNTARRGGRASQKSR